MSDDLIKKNSSHVYLAAWVLVITDVEMTTKNSHHTCLVCDHHGANLSKNIPFLVIQDL